MESLEIGRVAKQAGLNPQTIRYHERRGLLAEPPRTESNYRADPVTAVLRVCFIERAQEVGFTLREIKEPLSRRAAPRTRCADMRIRAEAKLRGIDDKVRSLRAMRNALTRLMG